MLSPIGFAFRLLFDLGLHQDFSDQMALGVFGARDREIRLTVLWGCYVYDK